MAASTATWEALTPIFTEFMRSRLPGTVRLPEVLADLFYWIEGNRRVVRGADDEP